MNPTQSILLFIFLTNSAVSLSVFFTNPKRSQNQLFLLFSTSLALWVLFVLGIINSQTLRGASIGIRGASIAGSSIPVTFYLFCQAIAYPSLSFAELCRKSLSILILSIVVIVMCLTDFFLDSVTMPSMENGLQVPDAHYGKGFLIFMAFFPIVIYRTIYVFYQTLRRSEGIAKAEMQFTLAGMTSALPFAVVVHMLAIISGSSSPQQFGPLCIIPMNLVIAYGIATRRILGIEKVLRQAIAYALLVGFLTLIYLASWNAVRYALSDLLTHPEIVAQVIATLISILSLGPIQHNIHAATSKLISTKSMDVAATMKEASSIFQSVTTLDQLSSQFSTLAQNALHARSIAILKFSNDEYIMQHSPSSEKALRLNKNSRTVRMLISTKDIVSIDTLSRVKETKYSKHVIDEMTSLSALVAAGIFQKGELTGILLVGSKKNGGIYDRSEQDALQILCNQFAVALENARLYTEMQDSKIQNEIMLDQLASGVVVANPDREITLFNHEAQSITGINDKAAIGQNIAILPREIYLALEVTLENKNGVRNIDASLFPREDDEESSKNIRMGSAFLFGHDGKPMGALLVFTDITELKGLEEQVRRSDQLSSVGTLAAGMAHEIKNPLVTIKTFTQLLPQRYADDEFRNDFATLVAHEVSRIDGIVNELLSFSKPAKPHLIPMNIQDTIDQTLKLIHEQLSQKNITLKNNCRAQKSEIFGDARLLSQALINLTLNATEAIGQDGTITVGTMNCSHRFATGPDKATTRKCIRLQISDTGKGIERDSLQKIFDPFFTSKSEGTGMGLSVAHGIINEHHAIIEVESEPGRGTTFYVFIPILEEGAVT